MARPVKGILNARWLGCVPYQQGLEIQSREHQLVAAQPDRASLLLLEHPPVITYGKHAKLSFIKASPAALQQKGIGLYASDRGGQVTAHAPGQVVAYPIIPLSSHGLTVKKYVNLLEEAVIKALARWGARAHRDQAYPGIWHGTKKLCAIGIRVKNKVSMHGLALNICADLGVFSHIVPCGLEDRCVTNLAAIVAKSPQPLEVARQLSKELAELLQLEVGFCVTLGKHPGCLEAAFI